MGDQHGVAIEVDLAKAVTEAMDAAMDSVDALKVRNRLSHGLSESRDGSTLVPITSNRQAQLMDLRSSEYTDVSELAQGVADFALTAFCHTLENNLSKAGPLRKSLEAQGIEISDDAQIRVVAELPVKLALGLYTLVSENNPQIELHRVGVVLDSIDETIPDLVAGTHALHVDELVSNFQDGVDPVSRLSAADFKIAETGDEVDYTGDLRASGAMADLSKQVVEAALTPRVQEFVRDLFFSFVHHNIESTTTAGRIRSAPVGDTESLLA